MANKFQPGDTVIVTSKEGLVDLKDEIGEVISLADGWYWVQFTSEYAKKKGNGTGKWWMNPATLKLLKRKR